MIGSLGRQNPTVTMTPDLEKLCEWMFFKFKGRRNYRKNMMRPDDFQRLAEALVNTFDIDVSQIDRLEKNKEDIANIMKEFDNVMGQIFTIRMGKS